MIRHRLAPADFKVKKLEHGYQWFSHQFSSNIELCIEPAGKLGYEVALYDQQGDQIGVRMLVEPGIEDLPFSCFQRAMQCANVINEVLWEKSDKEFFKILGLPY